MIDDTRTYNEETGRVELNGDTTVYDQELHDKYGCNGDCYGTHTGWICGGIDTCEETRELEGIAELLALVIVLFISAAVIITPIAFIIYWIINILR